MIALLDCNNFYVSCERIFNKKLINKPVIILSNNDGCVISRSDEAKDLGITMGEPYFKIKNKVKNLGIFVYSSNYSLYGDISSRVMSIVKKNCMNVEIYSIDEAFIDIADIKNQEEFCFLLKSKLLKWTGIPVSIGIAKTKTLSKIANKLAKKENKSLQSFKGIYKLFCDKQINKILKRTNVNDIWGVGNKTYYYFLKKGINNAFELANINENLVRKERGVLIHKTVLELKGIQCYDIEKKKNKKKSLCVSRSFGNKVYCYNDLRDALLLYVEKASEKLRRERLLCGSVKVFLQTSRYSNNYYFKSSDFHFFEPVLDSRTIWIECNKLLKKVYLLGLDYSKVGVILFNLCERNNIQRQLFEDNLKYKKKYLDNIKLMDAVDLVNQKFGKGKLRISTGELDSFFKIKKTTFKKKKWHMKSDFSSPCYTTKWCDIPKVIIG